MTDTMVAVDTAAVPKKNKPAGEGVDAVLVARLVEQARTAGLQLTLYCQCACDVGIEEVGVGSELLQRVLPGSTLVVAIDPGKVAHRVWFGTGDAGLRPPHACAERRSTPPRSSRGRLSVRRTGPCGG